MNRSSKDKFSISINELYVIFNKCNKNLSKENWQDNIKLYLNKIYYFFGNLYNQRMVIGWLATLCEHAYYAVAHNKPIDVRMEFERQFKQIIYSSNLPKFLTSQGQIICGKRQPSFIDCISPTFDRFHVMECLPEIFDGCIDSIIIGGSMSYVPFLGIREDIKEKDYSDIDALVIINDNFFKKNSWEKFLKNKLFQDNKKYEFINRINVFKKFLHDNLADIFSQRFSINKKHFTVSPHFFTLSVFRKMVYTDLKKDLLIKNDTHYTVRDFRVNRFTHPCHARHTFNGERIESVIDGEEVSSGGYISHMPGYTIFDGKLYPGVYHTVILPSFLVFYDRTRKVSKLVEKFKNIIYQEVKKSQKKFPYATYNKAHNRYEIFVTGRFEEGLNSFISPEYINKYLPPSSFNIKKLKSKNLLKITNTICETKKNNNARNEARKKLAEWKKNALKKAEKEMKTFLNKNNLKSKISLAKKQKRHFCTVAIINARKEMIIKIPQPYNDTNMKDLYIGEELCSQTITPGELMRLNAYKKLSLIFGKAYVSTILSTASKSAPESYAIIIPIQ